MLRNDPNNDADTEGPMAPVDDEPQRMLGGFIRTQRQLANLSLRQLSALAKVSNPYLSQVERGLHEPSVRVLKAIADALNLSAETLFEQAGLIGHTVGSVTGSSGDNQFSGSNRGDDGTESAIRADRCLTEIQRRAMLTVYHSYVEDNSTEPEAHPPVGQGSTSLASRLGDSTS